MKTRVIAAGVPAWWPVIALAQSPKGAATLGSGRVEALADLLRAFNHGEPVPGWKLDADGLRDSKMNGRYFGSRSLWTSKLGPMRPTPTRPASGMNKASC